MLSPEERERLASFAHPDRRIGFVLGRTAARTLIGEALGVAPEDAPLAVAESGAPVVTLAPEAAPLFVSIGHAGRGEPIGGAALASVPVGLDLERITRRHPDLWRRMLAPEEHALLDAMGGPTDEAQTLAWSLKEAVLKGCQTGLRAGMRSITLMDVDAARQRLAARDGSGGLWRLRYERRGDVWVSVALLGAA